MMKRLSALLLAVMMMLCAAFAVAEEPAAAEAPAEPAAEAPAEPAAEPAEEPAAEPAEEPAAETPAEPAAEAPAEPAEDSVLVTVNGAEIRKSDEMLAFWDSYFGNYYQNMYGIDPAMIASIIQPQAMNYTIHYTILSQKLTEEGENFSEEARSAVAKEQWDGIVNDYMTQMFGVSEDATDEEKEQARKDVLSLIETTYGITEENYLADAAQDPIVYVVLINEAIGNRVAGKYDVTDEEVEKYFHERAESDKAQVNDSVEGVESYYRSIGALPYFMPAGYRGITHILLRVDDALLNTWKDLQARLEEQNEPEQEGTEQAEAAQAEAAQTEAAQTEAAADAEAQEPVTQEMVDAAKQAILDSVQSTVDEIRAKLSDGASFEDLIREYGQDPGMDEDTMKTGYPVHADSKMWEANFQQAAMALGAPGDISEPVVGSFGVHILYYLRDVPAGEVEYTDEIKAEMRQELETEKYNEAVNELTAPWIEAADIQWTEAGAAWQPIAAGQ